MIGRGKEPQRARRIHRKQRHISTAVQQPCNRLVGGETEDLRRPLRHIHRRTHGPADHRGHDILGDVSDRDGEGPRAGIARSIGRPDEQCMNIVAVGIAGGFKVGRGCKRQRTAGRINHEQRRIRTGKTPSYRLVGGEAGNGGLAFRNCSPTSGPGDDRRRSVGGWRRKNSDGKCDAGNVPGAVRGANRDLINVVTVLVCWRGMTWAVEKLHLASGVD